MDKYECTCTLKITHKNHCLCRHNRIWKLYKITFSKLIIIIIKISDIKYICYFYIIYSVYNTNTRVLNTYKICRCPTKFMIAATHIQITAYKYTNINMTVSEMLVVLTNYSNITNTKNVIIIRHLYNKTRKNGETIPQVINII